MPKLGDENLSTKDLLWELAKLARGPVPYVGNMVIGELLKNVESSAGLPKGLLGGMADPKGLIKDYFKTEAGNQVLGKSDTSRLDSILNELRPSQFEQARSAGETPSAVPSSITTPDFLPQQDTPPMSTAQLMELLGGGQPQSAVPAAMPMQEVAPVATPQTPIDFGGTMQQEMPWESNYSGMSGSGGKEMESYYQDAYRQGGRVCSCHK